MGAQAELDFCRGTECNRVKIGGLTELLGDPNIKPEKPHTIVSFPGGDVEIARTAEGLYWVHVAVHRAETGRKPGRIVDARLDAEGRYCDGANNSMRSEIATGDVYHIAFLVASPVSQP